MVDVTPADYLRRVAGYNRARRHLAHDDASRLDDRAFAYAGAWKHYALYPDPRIVADARLWIREPPAKRQDVRMVVVVYLRVHHAVLGKHGAATDRHRTVTEYLDPFAKSCAIAYSRIAGDVDARTEDEKILSARLCATTNRYGVELRGKLRLEALAPVAGLPEEELHYDLYEELNHENLSNLRSIDCRLREPRRVKRR